jgi:hypothetical protein
VDSDPVIELLHAAYTELHRLEPLLQQNPIYRRVEALRRVIEEYEGIVGSRRPDLTFGPDPAMTTSVPEPTRDPTAPATVTPSRPPASPDLTRRASADDPAADPDVPANISPARVPTRGRSGWTRANSQAARIRDAACRRKIEMSPGVQSRDDTPRWPEPEEREFACIPAVKLSSAI